MYEYKVVPAPVRAAKVKGLKTTADRFAHALAEHINAEAAGGWQFQRTENLVCEERKRFGGMKTSTQTVMIFARQTGALRPDAGGALAAAQTAQPAYVEAQYDRAEAAQYEPAYDPEPEPPYEAQYEPPYEPAPARAPQRDYAEDTAAAPRHGRQEPLFRAAALGRPDPRGRAEPVLRPRAPNPEDDDGR